MISPLKRKHLERNLKGVGKSIPGRENNMCKGPEVRFCLEGLKKSKDAGRRGRKSEGESGRS